MGEAGGRLSQKSTVRLCKVNPGLYSTDTFTEFRVVGVVIGPNAY